MIIAGWHDCSRHRELTTDGIFGHHTSVVGQARDGQEAVELARRVRPDIVLMEVNMPRLDGPKATRQIVAQQSGAKVLMVSSSLEETVIRGAIQHGAMGYLSKVDLVDELLPAIRSLQARQPYFSQTVRKHYLPPPQARVSRHEEPSLDDLHNQLERAKEEARVNHSRARDVCQQSQKLLARAHRVLEQGYTHTRAAH